MTHLHPFTKRSWGLFLALALIMASCAKEPLDAPAGHGALQTKGLSTMANSGTDDPQNGGNGDEERDDDGDTISDDGDDVGDGERNKKKKAN